MNNKQKIIIVESPNERLAMNYAIKQANKYNIPLFCDWKIKSQFINFDASKYLNLYLQRVEKYESILRFLEQTGYSVVLTGTHVREYAFAQALNIHVNFEHLFTLDRFYQKLNTKIIVLYENNYKKLENEMLVEANYIMVDIKLKEFLKQTKCQTMLHEYKDTELAILLS